MLILPDRKLSRGSILMPVPRREWTPSSRAMEKDQLGNQNRQLWQITARLNDGHIVWRGTFEDRDEADAFLHALLWARMGGPSVPRGLWDLPTPSWFPGLGELITYEFASPIIIVSGTSQTSPSDYNNSNNSWQALGGGGSGGSAGSAGNPVATGGGGGEYRKISNFAVATPGTTTFNYTIGAGGTAVSSTAGGNAGVQTTFNTTSLVAKAGGGGLEGGNPQSGGSGGTGGTGAAGNANGGNGGASGSFNGVSTGGGGAGGSSGAGNSGVAGSGANSSTAGGSGDAGSGGSAGTASPGSTGTQTGGSGGNGAEFDASHGSGGGGGGAFTSTGGATATGGAGGNYGGGGGGAGGSSHTSGAGIQGIIWGIYVPVSNRYSNFFLNF